MRERGVQSRRVRPGQVEPVRRPGPPPQRSSSNFWQVLAILAPGEVRVIELESEAATSGRQRYRIHDAATGLLDALDHSRRDLPRMALRPTDFIRGVLARR